jgi:hypothetical protein
MLLLGMKGLDGNPIRELPTRLTFRLCGNTGEGRTFLEMEFLIH